MTCPLLSQESKTGQVQGREGSICWSNEGWSDHTLVSWLHADAVAKTLGRISTCFLPVETNLLARKGLGSQVGFTCGLAKLKSDGGYNSTSMPHTESLLTGTHGEGLKAVLLPVVSQVTTKDHEHPTHS